jgi:polar amino acid transport system substrate-binding protein
MKGEFITLLSGATIAWALAAHAQQPAQADQRIADLVRAGKIRIGVFPSTQYSKDSKTSEPKGLAIDITRALAARLGVSDVAPVEHSNPVEVVACVKAGGCDLGFIAIDPTRTTEVDFTPAYIRRDFTYLVPAGSSIRSAVDADRPEVRIAAVRGHASTAALVRVIKQAKPVYAEDFDPAIDLLRAGAADAFASVRETLFRYSTQLSGSHVLHDGYETSLVGIAIQKRHPGRLAYISEFLDDVKRSGWLRRAIDDAGLRGFEVVAPKETN